MKQRGRSSYVEILYFDVLRNKCLEQSQNLRLSEWRYMFCMS